MIRMKEYFALTKPGILYGNALTLVAGFMLAAHSSLLGVSYTLLFFTLLGLSLVIASGCVFNNYFDRDIDSLMDRTKKRALVTGKISARSALVFGALLFAFGVLILFFFTNNLALFLAVLGFCVYVFWYTMVLKRHSTHSTLLGGISGSIPPVVGYVSALGYLDAGAVLLFLLLTLWQMPHSFGIALYRLSDYKKASIPVLPVKKGIFITQLQILVYIVLFGIVSLLFYYFTEVGSAYVLVMGASSLWWIYLAGKGFSLEGEQLHSWAKGIFSFSIIILATFCLLLILGL